MSKMSIKRQRFIKKKYKSKLNNGQMRNDGNKIADKQRCLYCNTKLYRIEYDRLGNCCADCY